MPDLPSLLLLPDQPITWHKMGRGLFLLSQLHVYLIVDPLEPPVSCPTFLTEVILFSN